MAHQKHIYDLMKFDSYPRFIRSEHYRRLVEMELTNNYVTENDVTQAYKKGFDTQEDKKRKKSAFKLLKNAVNPIVSSIFIFRSPLSRGKDRALKRGAL